MEAQAKNTQSKVGLTPKQKKLYDIIKDFIKGQQILPVL